MCAALVARRRIPAPALPALESVEKILVLKLWGMGSIVLAAPLLRELRRRHPGARIVFVTLAENAAILRRLPMIDESITLDLGRGIPRFLAQTVATLWRIRRERYDLLLDLEFFTRFSAIFSFLARPRCSYGFSSKGSMRGQLHDAEVPFNTYHHVILNFLSLLNGEPVEPLPDFDVHGPEVLPRIGADAATTASLAARWRGSRAGATAVRSSASIRTPARWRSSGAGRKT